MIVFVFVFICVSVNECILTEKCSAGIEALHLLVRSFMGPSVNEGNKTKQKNKKKQKKNLRENGAPCGISGSKQKKRKNRIKTRSSCNIHTMEKLKTYFRVPP